MGKLADLELAIECQHRQGDTRIENISAWPEILDFLRDRFGSDRTNIQLWECMTDHLRLLGWDQERWLRMKYSEFIELLRSGLLNERFIPTEEDAATSNVGTDSLADLAMNQARSRKEVAAAEMQDQSILESLDAVWNSIYVPFPMIGKPVDYSQWTQNLLAFAREAAELGYSELFLKASPTREDERNALSLVKVAIRGGENAIRLRLLELDSPSADREWKIVFNRSSLFWSIVRPKHNGDRLAEAATFSALAPGKSDAKHTISDVNPDRRSIEEIERKTPELDTQSMEWIAARKENLEKLGLETNTLAKYRGAREGGRSLSEYFGIDRVGRRWRRDKSKTPRSTVYYFLPDLKKHG